MLVSTDVRQKNMDITLTTSPLSSETTPLLELTSSYQQRRTSRFTQTRTFSRAVICIRLVTFCTGLNFCSIFFSLAFFATRRDVLRFNSTVAWTSMLTFHGTRCVISVLGGWLADSKLGKFSVILCGILTCLFGTILLLIGLIKGSPLKEWAVTVYIIGLIFVAFGQGGIIANDILFSAEQVPNNGPATIQSFYYWWYWLMNVSEFLILTFLVYIDKNTSAYLYVHLVSVCSLVLALIVFLAGKLNGVYIIYPPYGSVILETLQVAKEAIKKSQVQRPFSRSFLDHWLDRAKTHFGGSFSSWEVDDVKNIYRLLPIFATLIFYYIVYGQIFIMVFQDQIGIVSFFITALILLPFMDKVAYPLLAKFDICPSQLQRIGIGMMFTVASMAWACGVELYRVEHCCVELDCGEQTLTCVSNITIFYRVPQYVLAGIGRVFTNFTAFEFFVTETPTYLQGVVMGLVWCAMGLGSFANIVLVLIDSKEKKWDTDEDQIKNGYLAHNFFALAGLMFIVFILYIYVAWSFIAKKESAERAYLKINEGTSTSFRYARNSSC